MPAGDFRVTPKSREDIREIAELASDDQLLRISELPEVPVSLEHLRHVDPQTRIVVGYRLMSLRPRVCGCAAG